MGHRRATRQTLISRITFLNFVLRPEIAAQEARYTRYATGNHSAMMLIDEEMRNDPSILSAAGAACETRIRYAD